MPNYFGRAVFVGNLPLDVRARDLEDLFHKFGRIVNVDIKTPARPPAFAFVEFNDPRDAEEAARRRDGVDFLGNRIRCEIAKGGDQSSTRNYRPVNARSSGYRVVVKNLPRSASWQDLKDHFRRVVKPMYTEVTRDRDGPIGIAEFETYDDMKLAIRKCHDTEFKNMFEQGVYIKVYEDNGSRGGGDRGRDSRRSRSPARRRSPSRSRSRSRSKSRSRSRSKSRSKSRSRSPARGRSKSRSRSRSASPKREAHDTRDKSHSPAPRDRFPSPARSD